MLPGIAVVSSDYGSKELVPGQRAPSIEIRLVVSRYPAVAAPQTVSKMSLVTT